ncbi:MAG: cyanophycin synthetase, partial [Terracoccus sp.]
VTCADDDGAVELARRAREADVQVFTYGFAPHADLLLSDHVDGLSSTVRLTDGACSFELRLAVPGRHNALNAAAAYAAAVHGLGCRPDQVLTGLASFTGTRRRFEPKGEAAGVVVVDDYAHNVGKVTAVVETAAGLVRGTGRLVVVFQPHLYSRTRDFAEQLGSGLSPADVVLVMDVYAAREDPVPGVSGALVADAVLRARAGVDVHYVPSWGEVAGRASSLVRPGDLLLTIGAGDVTMIGPEVLRLLEQDAP